jgi:hypothetical protein
LYLHDLSLLALAPLWSRLGSLKSTRPLPPIQRLTCVQQLTLNTWRLAAAKLDRVLDPCAILEHAAVHATLGALRNTGEPLALFRRHAQANPEFALIVSVIRVVEHEDLAYDMLDTAFLLRWDELVADGNGPRNCLRCDRGRRLPVSRQSVRDSFIGVSDLALAIPELAETLLARLEQRAR